PFFEARSLRHGEPECIGEDDGALDASSQRARKDGGRSASGPCAGEASDLFLPASAEGRAIEVRRVRRTDDLAVADEHKKRGHPSAAPEPTPITQVRSTYFNAASACVGALTGTRTDGP